MIRIIVIWLKLLKATTEKSEKAHAKIPQVLRSGQPTAHGTWARQAFLLATKQMHVLRGGSANWPRCSDAAVMHAIEEARQEASLGGYGGWTVEAQRALEKAEAGSSSDMDRAISKLPLVPLPPRVK